MAEIDVAPLTERLTEQEIAEILAALERAGAPPLPSSDDPNPLALGGAIDGDTLTEFMDRLEAHDLACDIYLPIELEGWLDAGELRLGSLQGLLEALEELRDELDIDADEDDQEDSDSEDESYGDGLLDRQLRECWQAMYTGAQSAADRHLPLLVRD